MPLGPLMPTVSGQPTLFGARSTFLEVKCQDEDQLFPTVVVPEVGMLTSYGTDRRGQRELEGRKDGL